MKSGDLQKNKIPSEPGVYFFLGKNKKVLYIGKATNLASRVRSYFGADLARKRSPFIAQMIEEAASLKWEQTDSVLEALILEAYFIKKYKPKYNIKERDDKSFNYVVVTDESFPAGGYPRVLLVRERDLLSSRSTKWGKQKYIFGPFPHGGTLKEALRLVRKMFPFRDKCIPKGEKGNKEGRPCFNNQIGLCPGVCTGAITKREYARTIANIKLFFEGKKKQLTKKLEREMAQYAKEEKFEKAAEVRHTLFALQHINDIALIKNSENIPKAHKGRSFMRIEAYDVAHISGTAHVGVMVAVVNGEPEKESYRKFNIKSVKGSNDVASLVEIMERRFGHAEWPYPKLIVVDGGKAQKNAAEKVLKNLGIEVPVVSVVKDERHKPREILGERNYVRNYEKEILLANNESHRFAITFHRKKRGVLK